MKNTLRLTESEFSKLVKRLVKESKNEIEKKPKQPQDREPLENIIYATEAGGASLIARLPNSTDEEILKVLEVGTRSIMMSHVKNVETARRFENATKYPPTGSRGLSPFTRIHKYSDERISQKMLSAGWPVAEKSG
jgi:2-keto-3-deoxy-L-rhamnonate aldolase RhmA